MNCKIFIQVAKTTPHKSTNQNASQVLSRTHNQFADVLQVPSRLNQDNRLRFSGLAQFIYESASLVSTSCLPGWRMLGFGLSGRAALHLLALSVQLGGDSRALGVVCPSFGLFVVLGLGDWYLEGCGVLAPLPPCSRALLYPSTLEGRFGGCRSQGCHGYSTRSARFHSWPHPPF